MEGSTLDRVFANHSGLKRLSSNSPPSSAATASSMASTLTIASRNSKNSTGISARIR